jgi:hypothetical protein
LKLVYQKLRSLELVFRNSEYNTVQGESS